MKTMIFIDMKKLLCSLSIFCAVSIVSKAQTNVAPTPDVCDLKPIMKNFTPNGDGVDDVFQIKSDCKLDNFSFQMFNRWGNSLYSSEDQNFQWLGLDGKEKLVEMGTYFYKVSYFLSGAKKEVTGFVSIVY
jgi:gliding motility-associated-like protein